MIQPLFAWELEHGLCIGVSLPVEDDGALLAAERAHAQTLAAARRTTWTGGRVALRLALERLGLEAPPLMNDERGAPTLPADMAGSLSHKKDVAVALLMGSADARVGVDVEKDVAPSNDISRHVLRSEEAAELSSMPREESGHEVVLRFSIKEAIYKALDPYVKRYVGFHEVATTPLAHGGVRVSMHLKEGEGPFLVEARWRKHDGLILTTAKIERLVT